MADREIVSKVEFREEVRKIEHKKRREELKSASRTRRTAMGVITDPQLKLD